jgi:putative protease
MVELLSPARDFPALSAALNNGADSVYIGLQGCNMRSNVSNFSLNDVKDAVKRAHDFDAELYVCTNTIMKDPDLNQLGEYLPLLKSMEVDALIVSDLGAVEIARKNGLEVHMSVQANISNVGALEVLKKLGVQRAILSRELSLQEIASIAKKSPLELEVFVHGALCMAVSGRCFISSKLYGKSANCGECLQPCRKSWKLLSEEKEELILDRSSENDLSYFLSPRDLSMIEYVPQLIESGVDVFKIEGRARPADYVATVTRVYREAIDSYQSGEWSFNDQWLIDLKKVFNRGFDQGFYFSDYNQNSPYNQSNHIKKDIGQVVNYFSRVSAAEIRLWGDLGLGDEIIIQGPTTGSITHKVESMEIEGKSIEFALKNQHVGLLINHKVRPNDLIYKRIKRSDKIN